uniref:NADH-ubiquinone oxidoreductase chain 4 n=1 Tax=Ectomomyrmex javanus TaxID=2571052 RepID=A0A4D6NYI0_9HYME|nr:NADH dehydrogenase subunit 4 [Ectomomyrmex javanus]QCE31830.1 NADH dehydrogenase subunit 4 [Ectomomyrmex javanus]
MVKYLLMILMMLFMIKKNKIMMFYYNMCFLMSFFLLFNYSMENYLMKNISMFMSVDYYSYILIMLSLWIMGLMLMHLFSNEMKMKKIMFLIMLLILMMFFMMKNIMLFYFFFEMSLIPTFMLIIYWGYNLERLGAAYFMLMYTMLISLPFLIYMIEIYNKVGSMIFFFVKMKMIELSFWSFIIIMGMFLVKMPMYFMHIWLPKAHVEAPVYGSMILAAILLKLGSYGLLQFMMIFMKSVLKFNNIMISIGIVGSLIISLVCLVQIDMKSMVAYSSVVHMNMMMCGLMSLYKMGFISSYIIMISHGLCSSGLFYMVNLYYYRSTSRLLLFNKGLMNLMPSFVLWWFLLCSSNFSFPLSISFISELFLLGVVIKYNLILMIYLMLISFFTSAYCLYLFSYIQYGELSFLKKFNSGSMKEYMILIIHLFPLVLMLINLNLF